MCSEYWNSIVSYGKKKPLYEQEELCIGLVREALYVQGLAGLFGALYGGEAMIKDLQRG